MEPIIKIITTIMEKAIEIITTMVTYLVLGIIIYIYLCVKFWYLTLVIVIIGILIGIINKKGGDVL